MLLCCVPVWAQSAKNNAADNIVGLYEGVQDGYKFRAKFEKEPSGTYRAQVVWMEKDRDAKGRKLLDEKNPDHSLRKTPCDRIVLIAGLRYDSRKHHWGDTKIYDPLRGIKAKVTCHFENDNTLVVKGSLLGISESVKWRKIS